MGAFGRFWSGFLRSVTWRLSYLAGCAKAFAGESRQACGFPNKPLLIDEHQVPFLCALTK